MTKEKEQTIEQLVLEIGSKRSLRIERWMDESRHWRAGIGWLSRDNYEFVCEYASLKKCLLKIKEYMENGK